MQTMFNQQQNQNVEKETVQVKHSAEAAAARNTPDGTRREVYAEPGETKSNIPETIRQPQPRARRKGLLIKGMGMPDNCAKCRLKPCILFELETEDRPYTIVDIYEFLNSDFTGNRYGNCPLEEVAY